MATPIPTNRAAFTVDAIAEATRGSIVRRGSLVDVAGVVTDSRALVPGNVFVAIKGESHDGHAFVAKAVAAHAAVILVERGRGEQAFLDGASGDATFVEVDDTLIALGDLARVHLEAWRARAPHGAGRKVIAITGSAGKTTTKELLSAILGAVAPTHYTAGNLNNRVGVPHVVLGLEDSHRFVVLEMGMSLPGELDLITSFARPDVSVVTNVGLAHAEGVGGPDGVMREKGAVYRALASDGVAVINADDARVMSAASATSARTRVTFGTAEGATYRLVRREARGEGGSLVVLATPGRELSLLLPLPGEAAAIDLAAALAAQETASGTLLPIEALEAELATVQLAGRATVKRLGQDVLVLDDTYNANPGSMRAALATLAEIAGSRRRVAILGEMKELGSHAESEHDALGDALAVSGVTLAIGCGGLVDRTLARAASLAPAMEVVAAPSTEEAAREAGLRVRSGDAVLVKGSRSVGAERVVAVLTETWPGASESATSRAL